MHPIRFLLASIVLCAGCSAVGTRVSYYDRNADGKVDLEKHRHPGKEDADWVLRDNDFDGKYETKVLYGVAVKESSVDQQVPTGVRMEKR
ncbi:MAG: hypothetical protein V4819_09340 [Verrucomicrobiota bacterium]